MPNLITGRCYICMANVFRFYLHKIPMRNVCVIIPVRINAHKTRCRVTVAYLSRRCGMALSQYYSTLVALRRSVQKPVASSTAHRSNGPDHWAAPVLDRSAVGQLSSLSSRTKRQRLPAGDTLRIVYRLPAIAAVLLYWITMKVVQQLTGLTQAPPMVRPIRPVSCWTRSR